MAEVSDRNKQEAMKERLESLAKSSTRFSPRLLQAIRDLLTAINYEDEALIESSLSFLQDALRKVARNIIQTEVNLANSAKSGIQKVWHELIDGFVCDNFDGLKKLIDAFIDERIASSIGVRDELVKLLQKEGCSVDNAQQLETCIHDLRRFKEDISKDWPSPSKPPSPLNQQAIAQVKAAIARGEKGMRKDELVWGNDPTKKKDS